MRIVLKEQGCRIPSRSDLKRRSLGLLEEHRLNKRTKKKKNDNRMSSDMGSLPGPKIQIHTDRIHTQIHTQTHCELRFETTNTIKRQIDEMNIEYSDPAL